MTSQRSSLGVLATMRTIVSEESSQILRKASSPASYSSHNFFASSSPCMNSFWLTHEWTNSPLLSRLPCQKFIANKCPSAFRTSLAASTARQTLRFYPNFLPCVALCSPCPLHEMIFSAIKLCHL